MSQAKLLYIIIIVYIISIIVVNIIFVISAPAGFFPETFKFIELTTLLDIKTSSDKRCHFQIQGRPVRRQLLKCNRELIYGTE